MNEEKINQKDYFTIIKDNKIFFFSLSKCLNNEDNEEKIIIQCLEKSNFNLYEIKINLSDFWSLNNILKIFETINDIYRNFLTLFKSNEIQISIETNTINIYFNICDIFGEKNRIKIILTKKDNIITKCQNDLKQIKEDIIFIKDEKSLIMNEINNLKKENKNLLEKYNSLKSSLFCSKISIMNGETLIKNSYNINEEDKKKDNNIDIKEEKNQIRNLEERQEKEKHENKINFDNLNSNAINIAEMEEEDLNKYENDDNFNSLSLNLKFEKKLIENINKQRKNDNNDSIVFTAFKSKKNINYLIYKKNQTTIILYDITNEKKDKIRNAHEDSINFIKHYIFQRFNKGKDIIATISQKNCKIWDIDSLNKIYDIKLSFKGQISSICLFPEKDNMLLFISSKLKYEPIKYYDFYNKEAKIEDSDGETNYINVFYDKETSKNILISCSKEMITAFDLSSYNIYKIFVTTYNNLSAILFYDGKKSKLIYGNEKGIIHILNFQNSILLSIIPIGNSPIHELLFWNEKKEYILCCDGHSVNLIHLKEKKEKVTQRQNFQNEISLVKIKIKNSECLLIEDKINKEINLWKIK